MSIGSINRRKTAMRMPLRSSLFTLALAMIGHTTSAAQADDQGAGGVPATSVAQPETSSNTAAPDNPPAAPTIQTSLGKAGDPGGIRAFLDSKGIDYSFTYIGEVLGNSSGGVKQGATYEGRLDATLDIDTDKLAGWKNGTIHAEAFQIHGRGLSGNNLLDLFTTSGIEAYPDTKLYELWYEHKFMDGKFFVRLGQLAADTEFFLSQTATLFVNSSFGFPASLANDLPDGGPAYPLATPGIRLKAQPNDNWTFLAAVFNGDPAGPFIPGVNNPLAQIRDRGGVAFRLDDPPLVMTEAQYAYFQGKDAKGLPGTVKLGYLHHFGSFAANDQPPGVNYRGDDGVYGIIDQTIYRKPGTDDQGANVFLRANYLPNDRNLIDFYIDGGVSYKGLIPGRDDDTIGVAGGYGHISSLVSAADAPPLVRDYQALIEVTYQATVLPGFTLQPDFQYVFHPGAHGVPDPNTGLPTHDAAVFGLRATVHY
jgi:porin